MQWFLRGNSPKCWSINTPDPDLLLLLLLQHHNILENSSRAQRKQPTNLKARAGGQRRSICSADRYFNWTQRGRRQANKSNTAAEKRLATFLACKTCFSASPQVERLTAVCSSCTCFFFFFQPSLGIPIKVVAFFRVQLSILCLDTRTGGRGPAEISFANRWELAGPLGWDARSSRLSRERCGIYWFSGEKKITIQTSSLQFLGSLAGRWEKKKKKKKVKKP